MMGVFEPEEIPLFTYETARRVEDAFTQKPMLLPLAPNPREIVYIQREQNWLPIVALVLGFFGFLAFLAYLRKS